MPAPAPTRRYAPFIALTVAFTLGACATKKTAEPETRNAQMLAPPNDSCELAREDAALDPRLDVERVPAPLQMVPPPIRTPVPRSALRRDGSSSLKVEVLVDTLGKPDMSTFTVIESTSAWLTTGARNAIAQWTFEPALRNGCKVARYYQFVASSPPRRR
jgi:outer membrane biosynthesis protein TonB